MASRPVRMVNRVGKASKVDNNLAVAVASRDKTIRAAVDPVAATAASRTVVTAAATTAEAIPAVGAVLTIVVTILEVIGVADRSVRRSLSRPLIWSVRTRKPCVN